jgi:hypothetical protein
MMIFCSWNQGFRIVLHPMYQNGGGYTKLPQIIKLPWNMYIKWT